MTESATATLIIWNKTDDGYDGFIEGHGHARFALVKTPGRRWQLMHETLGELAKPFRSKDDAIAHAEQVQAGEDTLKRPEAPAPEAAANVVRWGAPELDPADWCVMHVWQTECKRLQAVRIELPDEVKFAAMRASASDSGPKWQPVQHGELGSGYPRYYPTLRQAMEAGEALLSAQLKQSLDSDREDALTAAATEGLGGSAPTVIPRAERNGTPAAPAAKQPRPEGTPSTKEAVYRLWAADAARGPDATADYFKAIGEKVKLSTIKGWVSAWGRGQNLPACAKQ